MLPIYIALVYEGTKVPREELTRVATALAKQVTRDFGPIWGVEATVNAFFSFDDVPLGSWKIILVEDGGYMRYELGYHQDTFGQPYAKVALTNSWSLTASHECLEMLANPFGDRMVPGPSLEDDKERVSYLVEVCDPVQSSEFSYTVNDVMVSDFVTPDFYGPDPVKPTGVRYSFTGAATTPREVKERGYISWHNHVKGLVEQLRVTAKGEPITLPLGRFEDFMGSVMEFVDVQTENPELEQGVSHDNGRLQAAIQAEERNREGRKQAAESLRATAESLRVQMSSEQDKTLVESFWNVFNRAISASDERLDEEIEGLYYIIADDFCLYTAGGSEFDADGVARYFRIIRDEVPDLQIEIDYEKPVELPLTTEGSSTLRSPWRGRGHYEGESQTEEVKVSGVRTFRISQGKIIETRINPGVAISERISGTGGFGRMFRAFFG